MTNKETVIKKCGYCYHSINRVMTTLFYYFYINIYQLLCSPPDLLSNDK